MHNLVRVPTVTVTLPLSVKSASSLGWLISPRVTESTRGGERRGGSLSSLSLDSGQVGEGLDSLETLQAPESV